jgi:hypothetical protein
MDSDEIEKLKAFAKSVLQDLQEEDFFGAWVRFDAVSLLISNLIKAVDSQQQQMLSLTQQCDELRSRVNLPRG